MIMPGQSRIINEREDFLLNFVRLDQPRPSWLGTIDQAIDPFFIKGFDPQLQRPLTDTGVLKSNLEGATAAQKVDNVETMMCLLIRTARERNFKLFQAAVFVVRELTSPSDFQSWQNL
jgi:hypothetical protein